MPGLKGGVAFEAEFLSNPSSGVTQFVKSISPTLDERHMHVYLDGGFGRVSLGQSDGAANGASEVDLSGTGVFASMTITDWGGSLLFCNTTDVASAACTGASVKNSIANQDFESRYDRVRYDTPALGPVKISVSSGVKSNEDTHEAAVWFASDLGTAGKLEAALGYSIVDRIAGNANRKTVGGSASWLLPMGLNFTVGYTEKDIDQAEDPNWLYAKVGYKTGKHAASVEWSQGNDQNGATATTVSVDREATMVGLAYVYKPVAWAELFAGYRHYELDQPGATLEDIDLIAGGVYFKF
jgi:hypothetical protein